LRHRIEQVGLLVTGNGRVLRDSVGILRVGHPVDGGDLGGDQLHEECRFFARLVFVTLYISYIVSGTAVAS